MRGLDRPHGPIDEPSIGHAPAELIKAGRYQCDEGDHHAKPRQLIRHIRPPVLILIFSALRLIAGKCAHRGLRTG